MSDGCREWQTWSPLHHLQKAGHGRVSFPRFDCRLPPPAVLYSIHNPEKDPGEVEFRFHRHVKFVYLLGLTYPNSLLKGMLRFRGNLHTRRQNLGSGVQWEGTLGSVGQTFQLFPMARIRFHYPCSRPTFKNKSISYSF